MHHKYRKKDLESRIAASKSENGIPQSPPRQPRPNSSGQIELEAEPTPRETRPLAGTRPDPAPASTGEPEPGSRCPRRNSPEKWRHRAQKTPEFSTKPSTAQLPQAAGPPEGFDLGGLWCESDEIRVYGARSWGFFPSLFNFF
ncbi:hypothetical protein PVAP13_3KG375154 [Panicum virgatum]|uniref:Uncharacterized protein n=1 Tax=Panicum virgatum TaxID=38727 RepID=A0A8T0UV75_PANVG|nr:hypothetical protein PVAP13_3KG375154 [Panicum virgatum]